MKHIEWIPLLINRKTTRMGRLMPLFMAMVLVCTGFYPTTVVAAGTVPKIAIDGEVLVFPDEQPFIDENGRTLAPARFIAEAMGATVSWDASIQTATLTKGYAEIRITVGVNTLLVNGFQVTMDTTAVNKNGRIFIPVRYVAEALGAMVGYNNIKNQIEITFEDLTITQIIDNAYKDNLKMLTLEQQNLMQQGFRNIQNKMTDDPEGYIAMAYMAYVMAGADPKAQTVMAAWGAQQYPDSVMLMNNLGYALFALCQYENAEKVFKRTLELDMESLETMINLANLYMDTNRIEDAKSQYEAVIALDEENEKAWEGLYGYYMKKGEYGKAMEIAAKINPIGFVKGGVYEEQKAIDEEGEGAKLDMIDPADSLETMTSKIEAITKVKPLNAGNILEGFDPVMAQEIRDEMEQVGIEIAAPATPFVVDFSNAQMHYVTARGFEDSTIFAESSMIPELDASGSDLVEKYQNMSEEELNAMMDDYLKNMNEMYNDLQNVDFGNMEEVMEALEQIQGSDATDPLGAMIPSEDTGSNQLGLTDKKTRVSESNYNNYLMHKINYDHYFNKLTEEFGKIHDDLGAAFTAEMTALRAEQEASGQPMDSPGFVNARNSLRDSYVQLFGSQATSFYSSKVKPAIEKVETSQALYIKNMADDSVQKREAELMKIKLNGFLGIFAQASAPVDGYETSSDEARQQLEQMIEAVKANAVPGQTVPQLQQYDKTQKTVLEKIYEDHKFEGAVGLVKVTCENAEITVAMNDPINDRYMDLGLDMKNFKVSMTEGRGHEVAFKVASKETPIGDYEAEVGYSTREQGTRTTIFLDADFNPVDAQVTQTPGTTGVSAAVGVADFTLSGEVKMETTAEGTSTFISTITGAYQDIRLWVNEYKEKVE